MNNKSRRVVATSLIYLVLSIWAFTTIYPFVWVFLNSFKDTGEIVVNSFSLPFGKNFTLENYQKVLFGKYNLFRAYGNSFIISISVVVGVLLISSMAAFALARFPFKGKKIIMGATVACMMFPIFSIIFPLISMINKMNLMNEYLGVILPQIAGNLAFTIILLTGFFSTLPLEVEESAFIDGANVFQILFKLVLPMSKGTLSTAAIFVFLWSYNDLFLQMQVLTDKKMMPIGALLREISSKEAGTDQGLMVASVAVIAIPILIVYCFLQKHIIKGLTAGAVKG